MEILVNGWRWGIQIKKIRKDDKNNCYEMFLFSVDVNLKYQTYCHAIAAGGDKEWDFAWKRYRNSPVASEKKTILSALGCTKKVQLLER